MISFRRKHIDNFLERNNKYIKGDVLDVGGKKINRRGTFNPLTINYNSWKYLNTDPKTKPDFVANANDIPLSNNTINTIIFCETLEYIENPLEVFSEFQRILIPGCYILGTCPFLSPLHGDKEFDKYRYTKTSLLDLFKHNKFEVVSLKEMGSTSDVIFDLLRVQLSYHRNLKNIILLRILNLLKPIFLFLSGSENEYINTGYSFVLKKND